MYLMRRASTFAAPRAARGPGAELAVEAQLTDGGPDTGPVVLVDRADEGRAREVMGLPPAGLSSVLERPPACLREIDRHDRQPLRADQLRGVVYVGGQGWDDHARVHVARPLPP